LHCIKDRRKAVGPFCAASHTFKSINLPHTQIYCQQGLLTAKTLLFVSLSNYVMGIHLFCSSKVRVFLVNVEMECILNEGL
jgi:hypothetical protein